MRHIGLSHGNKKGTISVVPFFIVLICVGLYLFQPQLFQVGVVLSAGFGYLLVDVGELFTTTETLFLAAVRLVFVASRRSVDFGYTV